VAWSQARPAVRAEIEAAMLAAADAMLENMTMAKPVVAHQRALWPARGFAAAAALHVLARAAGGDAEPSPQLHVHSIVVGVERDDGFFASPELSGMFKYGAPLEGGAVARAKLAERLVDMGFEIVRTGRFFELQGVPEGLVRRMSGRTKDVEAGIRAREKARGKQLTLGEKAVVALETRVPKRQEAGLEETVAAWTAQATEFGFGPYAVDALRSGSGFSGDADKRRAQVAADVRKRMRAIGPAPSVGATRALVFECAAGRLRLDEAGPAVDQLAPPPG
jgi:conjugative relaxase-like TrwC/TraI family protein